MDQRALQIQACMYQYSRAIYRSIKDLIDPYVDSETRVEYRREVLEACEQTTAPTTTTSKPKPPPKPKKALTPWPSRAGWTVVLASVPTSSGRGAAVAQADRALAAGLKSVGVLDSSRFSSLHPGYYVVFSGIYRSEGDANSGVADAHARGYPVAYPRRITP